MSSYRAGYGPRATGHGQMRACVWFAPVALLLAGCGSLLETDLPVSTQYVLAPAPAAASGAPATQADLSIGHPDVAPGLDTSRIAVLRGQQLDYYRGATWGGS